MGWRGGGDYPLLLTHSQRLCTVFPIRSLYLGGEALATHVALEGTLLGVAAHVDLQRGVAGKHLEAELAGRLAPRRCKQIFSQLGI